MHFRSVQTILSTNVNMIYVCLEAHPLKTTWKHFAYHSKPMHENAPLTVSFWTGGVADFVVSIGTFTHPSSLSLPVTKSGNHPRSLTPDVFVAYMITELD